MRFERFPRFCGWLLVATVLLITSSVLLAQETTGGLQGTVKDTSGAVVSHAHVIVRGAALAGEKSLDSESNGYYRFANLPPGIYSLEVTAKGFIVLSTRPRLASFPARHAAAGHADSRCRASRRRQLGADPGPAPSR